jgi:uncharacterized metal-binding protein
MRSLSPLSKRKVGLVACSGEELPEGTISRLAALQVLHSLRPHQTVTICLPLFLAGGEGDRAFARFHPTIAIDGCDKRCAARATQIYSAKPAVSLVVSDFARMAAPGRARHLAETGKAAVDAVAQEIANHVDRILGSTAEEIAAAENTDEKSPSCACGAAIASEAVDVAGRRIEVLALPLICERLRAMGKSADECVGAELLGMVAIYNSVPAGEEAAWTQSLVRVYENFCRKKR